MPRVLTNLNTAPSLLLTCPAETHAGPGQYLILSLLRQVLGATCGERHLGGVVWCFSSRWSRVVSGTEVQSGQWHRGGVCGESGIEVESSGERHRGEIVW